MKFFLKLLVLSLPISLIGSPNLRAELPDLARLKLAAEGGDPISQFSYGQRIALTNSKEQYSWYLRSAEQGYAPAQDAMAAHTMGQAPFTPKTRQLAEREAVRWASRAAFQGLPSAQLRLSSYYERGDGLQKGPVTAYMWAQIVFTNPNSSMTDRIMAGYARDRIIANTSSANIQEGQRRAAAFTYPGPNSINPIEAELVYTQLKLVGIFHLNGHTSAAVNNVRFNVGDTKEVKVDDHMIKLTCVSIESNFALFKLEGTQSPFTLTLKR